MRTLFLLIIFFFVFSVQSVEAQYTQVGNGGFTSSIYGPTSTDVSAAFYNRHAYIYPSGSLGNLAHGDTLTALAFRHNSFDSLAGTTSLKIYIKNTASADFGTAALNWMAETRNGMTLVYEGDPKDIIGNTPGFAVFLFNKASSYRFDTTGNKKHLQILVEYKQNTTQAAALPWYCENSFYVPSFSSNNETKFIRGNSSSGFDSITNSSSIIKPTLRIYHPKHNIELEANRMYALGTYPILMDKPDSIKVVIRNSGKNTAYNHKVFLDVTGANSYKDSLVMDSLKPYSERFVYFTNYEPSAQGTELLTIRVDSDAVASNNEISKPRAINYNVYSHVDPFSGNSGGIGFNGSTGDFVAKFYVNGSSYINQIKVDFALSGRAFQLGIWDDNGPGGLPGTLLFISDSSISTAGTFIMPVLPKVQVTNGYYVGIRQTSNTNVSFAFQYEVPIRPHTFYFAAPASDTNWVSFSPGYDYNFNIQPRLQVGNDLGILEITSPAQFDSIRYSSTDSMELKAKIINYGFINQGLFPVKMEILNRFNQVVYTSFKSISLNSGDTAEVNFDKFSRYNIGQFKARASVDLNIDSVKDNNSLEHTFYLVKDNDVAVDFIYEPNANDSFEINQEGFWPTVRIINYGIKTQNNFTIRADLLNNEGQVIATQDRIESLGPEVSQIINFDSVFLKKDGKYTFRAYTMLSTDSFPSNDTAKVVIYGKKTYDVKILNIIRPTEDSKFAKNAGFQPFINYRNDGRKKEDSTYFYARIENASGTIIYTDTIRLVTNFLSSGQVLFKTFPASTIGEYTFYVKCYIQKDQIRENDTLSSRFSVVTGNDLQLLEIIKPKGAMKIGTLSAPPRIVVRNNGLLAANNALITFNIESNFNANYFTDSLYVNLASFSTDTFELSKSVPFVVVGDYYITAINRRNGEDFRNDLDTLKQNYIVRYGNDLGITNHLFPINIDTLEHNDDVAPRVQIVNYGLDTSFDIKVLVSIQNVFSELVYTDTLKLSELAPNRGNNFTSTKLWTAKAGFYTLRSKLLNTDGFSDNDSFSTTFIVRKKIDILIDSVLLPVDDVDLIVDRKYKPAVRIKNDGYEDSDNIVISCEVRDGASLLYIKSKIVTLAAHSDTLISFDSSLTSNDSRTNVLARFVVSKLGDLIRENDTMVTSFNFVKGVSVEQLTKSTSIQVYPNPFSSFINVKSDAPIEEIKILDINGKLLLKQKANKELEIKLNVELAMGTYILEVYTSKGGPQRLTILRQD